LCKLATTLIFYTIIWRNTFAKFPFGALKRAKHVVKKGDYQQVFFSTSEKKNGEKKGCF
jgi:hypothetical protein